MYILTEALSLALDYKAKHWYKRYHFKHKETAREFTKNNYAKSPTVVMPNITNKPSLLHWFIGRPEAIGSGSK
jgi:hypothetical protein